MREHIDIVKDKIEGEGIRGFYKAMGYGDDDLERPIIGIANAYSTLVSGHFNLREVAEHVKNGIYRGGGTAVEFGVIGGCDGIANGHSGMHYILPMRELIADSIECMAIAHNLDGLVLLGSCDKIVPGMLMAAARLDIPCILLPGGPMINGHAELHGRILDKTGSTEAIAAYSAGEITWDEFKTIEDTICGSCGSCTFYGTANTMCALSEAMGMTIPNGAMTPAADPSRLRLATETGVKICDLVRNKVGARDIITSESIRNAIRVCTATSGSTNAFMHLSAIAREAQLDINVMDEFEKINAETPVIARVYPSCASTISDLHYAGGVPRIMKNLLPMLNPDVMTVTGKTLGENIEEYGSKITKEVDCITTLNNPYEEKGGLQVLRGNLAPDTAVTKPGAIQKEARHFIGKAICFDCEEDANKAILDGKIEDGMVIVIRYEGPKGGPGMREMYRSMKFLNGLGKATTVALVTDGRFSGTNNGCFVGHISPEAALGGPIAAVKDGDTIEIDTLGGLLKLCISDEELAERMKHIKPFEPKVKDGYLARYSKLVSSSAEGAVLKFE